MFREWFFKICPGKSTSQVLTFKKKDEKGKEYIETFSLGQKSNNSLNNLTYSEFLYNYYLNAMNDTTSFDLNGSIPFATTSYRVIE
jgi:hypothetical protein